MKREKNIKQKTKNKNTVNIVALSIAVPLFVYALILVPPVVLVRSASAMLATAVGASASVPANPDNSLVQQLKEKESLLDQREQYVVQREREVAAQDAAGNTIASISLAGSLILFLLVGLNFYLDTRRRRDLRAAPGRFSLDLR